MMSDAPNKTVPARHCGPIVELPAEHPPDRLAAVEEILARVLAARALQAMRKEPANDNE